MDRLSIQLGFRVTRDWSVADKRCCVVNSREFETLRILAQLCESVWYPFEPVDTVEVRELVRRVEQLNCRAILILAIQQTPFPQVIRIAIWLRGRCGGKSGISTVVRFRDARHYGIRKEVARALKRMGAWSELREMARLEIDPRLKRISTAQAPKPFGFRLKTFSRNVTWTTTRNDRTEVRQREVFVSSEVDFRQGRPPKSIGLIRAILKRIHQLVSG